MSDVLKLIDNGELEAALSQLQSELQKHPRHAPSWFLTAIVYERLNNLGKAYFCLESAIKLAANNKHYLAYQAKLLSHGNAIVNISCHALSMAKEIVDDLDINSINTTETLILIATTYRKLKDFKQALAFYSKAASLSSKHQAPANIHNDLGVIYQLYNQNKKALKHLNLAIEHNPQDYMACWQLSQLTLDTPELTIKQLEKKLSDNSNNANAQIYLHYALARIKEKQQDYRSSFQHLQQGSLAYQQLHPYEVEDDLALFKHLASSYTQAFLQQPATNHSHPAQPIFIVGLPRTGTTLVEQIINGSPQLSTAGELLHFNRFFEAACSQLNPQHSGIERYQNLANVNHALLGKLYLQSCIPLAGNTPYFIDKYPFNFILVGAIAKAIPQAKFVHIRRNPMDACFSNYKHLFRFNSANYSYSLTDLGHYYQGYKELTDHWQQCLPQRFYTLHYDELVSDPIAQSQALMRFLNLDWQPQLLDFHQSKHAVSTPSAAQVKQKIYRSSQQHWRHYETELAPLVKLFEQ
ncbi:sulfotransferase [Dasania sp. GY-MA-18]|uniref:Sulfotransferase n=1 Tax=Dasania phycosphaerae TaxID=2950436 RepID=A0A9J6RNJ0_9GAMM|nr:MULTISPECIES: tetratricopeptide repeat-containing sulfotransferase family protein [Dasania]MCR8923141.1 sulfotransferase [Dasania sp. GY-MA-18]MCZ0865573.1 sulfotransferase [Dasania phycosphaerae]MCZ0869298.1 sulfotransferase [Dasania phycosphaerae]